MKLILMIADIPRWNSISFHFSLFLGRHKAGLAIFPKFQFPRSWDLLIEKNLIQEAINMRHGPFYLPVLTCLLFILFGRSPSLLRLVCQRCNGVVVVVVVFDAWRETKSS